MYNRIIGLIGPTGSGKSYRAAEIMASTERCAVYQLKRIHEEPAFAMCADDIVDGNLQAFILYLTAPEFRIVYLCQPPGTEGKRLHVPDLDIFIQACYTRERMTMIIDEAHFFCDPWHIPIFFRQAVVMGRSRYLDTIYCAQKFSTISKELTANTHEFYFWKITEPRDLADIGERCGTDVAEKVANLRASEDNRRVGGEFQAGEYLRWENTGRWEVVDPWKQNSTFASHSDSSQELQSEESEPQSSTQGELFHADPPASSAESESTGEEQP